MMVHLVQGPEPGAAAAQPGHGSPPCSEFVTPSQAAVAALMACPPAAAAADRSLPGARPAPGPRWADGRRRR
jgi:hypothetical protein